MSLLQPIVSKEIILYTIQKMRVIYFKIINNILSEMNKLFTNISDFLTEMSVFNLTPNNFLNDNFV